MPNRAWMAMRCAAVLGVSWGLGLGGSSALAQGHESPRPVVTVDGHVFDQQELADRLFQRFGRAFTQYCVDLFLYEQEAARVGITASEDEVETFVTERLRAVMAAAGGEEAYMQALQAIGSSVDAEWRRLREDGRPQLLAQKIIIERRGSPENLRRAYDLNFGARVKLRTLCLAVQIPDGEDTLFVEAQRRREAERLTSKLSAGAEFSRVAQDMGLAEENRGWVAEASLESGLRRAMAGLGAGQSTPPLRTPRGYEIYWIEEREAPEAPFEEVAERIRQALATRPVSPEEIQNLTEDLRSKAQIRWSDDAFAPTR